MSNLRGTCSQYEAQGGPHKMLCTNAAVNVKPEGAHRVTRINAVVNVRPEGPQDDIV